VFGVSLWGGGGGGGFELYRVTVNYDQRRVISCVFERYRLLNLAEIVKSVRIR